MAIIKSKSELFATPSNGLPTLFIEMARSMIEVRASDGDGRQESNNIKADIYAKIFPEEAKSNRAKKFNSILAARTGNCLNAKFIDTIATAIDIDSLNEEWLKNNNINYDELDLKQQFFMTALKKMKNKYVKPSGYKPRLSQLARSASRELGDNSDSFLVELGNEGTLSDEDRKKIDDFLAERSRAMMSL